MHPMRKLNLPLNFGTKFDSNDEVDLHLATRGDLPPPVDWFPLLSGCNY